MTALHTPAVQQLINAAKFAKSELKAWMRNHGQDLDTSAAILDIDAAIKAVGADAAQAAGTAHFIATQADLAGEL